MRRLIALNLICLALLVAALASMARAQSAVELDNPLGDVEFETATGRDQNALGTPAANFIWVFDNDTGIASDPTCANKCASRKWCLIDSDESSNDVWTFCHGGSTAQILPVTGADTVTDAQIFVGTGNGTGAYVTMSGDGTITNAGVFDLTELSAEAELEAVLDLNELQGQITDTQIADDAVDGGTGGEIADASVTAADLAPDSVSASELNASGVASELEAALTLANLQGTLGSSKITDDSLTVADVDNDDTLAGNPTYAASECWFSALGFICEGSTADGVETLIQVADPTSSDKTITIPNETGTVCTTANVCTGYSATSHTHAAADVTSGSFADGRVDGSLEADEVNPTLGSQTQGDYVASVSASSGVSCTGCTAGEGGTPALTATLGTDIATGEIVDGTIAYADVNATATLGGNPTNGDSSVWFGTTGLICEGATSNAIETLITCADPTSTDKTITFPDETGTVCTTGSVCGGYSASGHTHTGSTLSGIDLSDDTNVTVSSPIVLTGDDLSCPTCVTSEVGDVSAVGPGCATGACFTDGLATSGTTLLVWEGTSADSNELIWSVPANPGADITWTVPDAATSLTFPSGTDTLVGRATTDTLTNKTLTTPVIADFTSAAHDHGDADDGGALATDSVGSTQVAADAIGTSEIATDGVGAAEIVADGVGASELAQTAIQSGDVEVGDLPALTLAQLNALTSDQDVNGFRTHATDCTSLTDGKTNQICIDLDDNRGWFCEPDSGDCSGTEWKAIGALSVTADSTDQGWVRSITFDPTDFDWTAGSLSLGTSISRLGNEIIKTEASSTFVHNDQDNILDGDLDLDNQNILRLREAHANGENFKAFQAPATVTSDTTCVLENDADFIPDSCVGNGSDANTASVTPHAFYTATALTLASQRFFNFQFANTSVSLPGIPMGLACTVTSVAFRVTRFGAWPSGATITAKFMKNGSTTSQFTTGGLTASTDTTVSGSLTFAATDYWTFDAACSGTCTDNSTILYISGQAACKE